MSKKIEIQELNTQISDMWIEIQKLELYLHDKQLLDDYRTWKLSLRKNNK